MAADQQLERSVLERKERDELRAIAQAMSLDTNSRSKKADIIDQILRAAGVEVGSQENGSNSNGAAKTATTRSRGGRRSASSTAPAEDDDSSGAATSTGADGANAVSSASTRATGTTTASGGGSNGAGAPTSSDSILTDPDGATEAPSSSTQAEQENGAASSGGSPATSRAAQTDTGAGAGQSHQTNAAPARQSAQGGAHEGGGRRNRRRRNRDRSGSDRELQAGGQEAQYQGELVSVRGLLDLREEGYGFLRAEGYLPSQKDVYVSISQARRFALRKGDYVEGACRPAASNEKFPALIRIDSVNEVPPDEARTRPRFEDLTPLFPDSKLRLEMNGAAETTTRIIDLLSPIGKGQRGLIVSPPKAGKTTILKQIAHSIEANNPEVHLMVLLVDERPEEVTDMRRSVKGEVVASTFDRPSDEHTAVAELAIERAKRLVEQRRDVVIVLDGITRLARAYNLAQPATGRIMSGGVDSGALYPPKKFFGAARNIEEGGSLTILATALVETGSRMDEVIFEEFKGTGNMELRLDRRLSERRLYPSIDVNASSTRHEELLFERGQLQQVWKLRRVLNALAADGNAAAGLELLMDKIKTTKSNDEFLAEIAKGPAPPI
ncbi:MAG TPA: transcription termination factor Rho [Acidimicrobiales bacterium]|nr:transcription termination factor Rho [Acidimicrobiales bacterium]